MPNIKNQAGKNKETAKKAAPRTKTPRKEESSGDQKRRG